MLLTPGVFLRLGDNSELRMISPGLTDTQVELVGGEAQIEVTDITKDNHIRVLDHGVSTTLLKKGLYAFNADTPAVSVYDGKAEVQSGDNRIPIGKGKQVLLTGSPLKAVSFNRDHQDELYHWSNVRDRYLAERQHGFGPGVHGESLRLVRFRVVLESVLQRVFIHSGGGISLQPVRLRILLAIRFLRLWRRVLPGWRFPTGSAGRPQLRWRRARVPPLMSAAPRIIRPEVPNVAFRIAAGVAAAAVVFGFDVDDDCGAPPALRARNAHRLPRR